MHSSVMLCTYCLLYNLSGNPSNSKKENTYAHEEGSVHTVHGTDKAAKPATKQESFKTEKGIGGGEISLLDYLLETQYYYNAIDNLLLTERDLELSIAQLSAVEL